MGPRPAPTLEGFLGAGLGVCGEQGATRASGKEGEVPGKAQVPYATAGGGLVLTHFRLTMPPSPQVAQKTAPPQWPWL